MANYYAVFDYENSRIGLAKSSNFLKPSTSRSFINWASGSGKTVSRKDFEKWTSELDPTKRAKSGYNEKHTIATHPQEPKLQVKDLKNHESQNQGFFKNMLDKIGLTKLSNTELAILFGSIGVVLVLLVLCLVRKWTKKPVEKHNSQGQRNGLQSNSVYDQL